jgi:hypothetical protein
MAAILVNNLYNPELLKDDVDIGVMPTLHRFGYYVAVALQSQQAGDGLGYIRTLRKSVDEYKGMKGVIEFLLRDFSKNL